MQATKDLSCFAIIVLLLTGESHCLIMRLSTLGLWGEVHFQFFLTASLCGNSSQLSQLRGCMQRGLSACAIFSTRWQVDISCRAQHHHSSPQRVRMTPKGLCGILEVPHANSDTSLTAPDGFGKATSVGMVPLYGQYALGLQKIFEIRVKKRIGSQRQKCLT
jgi:hypothetical protein